MVVVSIPPQFLGSYQYRKVSLCPPCLQVKCELTFFYSAKVDMLDASAMSDVNLYFIVVRFTGGPKNDQQAISLNAYGMFSSFLEKYFTYSQLLRFSFSVMPYSKFLPTFS